MSDRLSGAVLAAVVSQFDTFLWDGRPTVPATEFFYRIFYRIIRYGALRSVTR
jgi:hypothetical protein